MFRSPCVEFLSLNVSPEAICPVYLLQNGKAQGSGRKIAAGGDSGLASQGKDAFEFPPFGDGIATQRKLFL